MDALPPQETKLEDKPTSVLEEAQLPAPPEQPIVACDSVAETVSSQQALEVPTLPQGTLWNVMLDVLPVPASDTEVRHFVATVRAEFLAYQARLEAQRAQLVERTAEVKAVQDAQLKQLSDAFNTMLSNIESHVDAGKSYSSLRSQTESHNAPTSAPMKEIQHVDEGTRLVNFWKAKQLHVAKALELLEEELEAIHVRITDLRALHDSGKYNALRMIGERRQEEAESHEVANGFRALLFELVSTTLPKERTRVDSAPKERLSAVERRFVDAEAVALKDLTSSVDTRCKSGKTHLSILTRRCEALSFRITDLQTKAREAPTASLDKTLEYALELRSKAANASEASADSFDLSQEHAAVELALRNQLEALVKQQNAEFEDMQRELRERRVKVIRTIHGSGGNVDQRFNLLRAHQHVAVVNRQIAQAESERIGLKLELAQASGSAARALEFIRHTEGNA